MRINHNIAALNTYRQLNTASTGQTKSMEKLSSGLRINKAGDDAAGLAISEKMRAQVRGLDQASANAQDGISMIQTAEGALNETHSILQRVRELADQSANGTNTAEDRKAIQDEVTQLKQEIDRIGNTTEFNTQKLLNGNLKSAAGASVGQNITTGATVGKLAAGTLTVSGSHTLSASAFSASFVAETLKIDGTEITVNWQNLSTDEQNIIKNGASSDATSQQKALDLMVSKINEAIDQSGTGVAHVSGYLSGGAITLTSGSEGTNSKIEAGSAGVLNEALGGAGTSTAGTDKYNGTAIAISSAFTADINGVTMNVKLTAAIANGTTAMSTAADILQSALNTAIGTANTTAGANSNADPGFIADVKVNVTKDGRFEIVSETGPVKLSDKVGETTVKDLGLSSAQTDASGNGGMTFQIGANKGQTITFGINDMRSAALGIAGVDVSTQAGASNALESLDKAIKNVSSERSKLGAIQNRLEHTINNLSTSSENLTAAESRIRDIDMAKEMMAQTKNSILSQAAQAMLAQANQQPQGVLQLLR
ncbi:flagellin/flagellar hook associated protein [Schinkia azotoformans MEV2011]|uniref:Flagellin n=1 Tax=Schinkia azotoformans MEV2011 TaxID=1348973 RepID=A0A072NSX3_SCHAZ|nr:flagellin [Schinkia azotoformans]KEF40327.1 flagellin/flagellar hook associated protein [Schinkia azotoformans MEV2011]MEC1696364.1 flagellin [Schinkia azotoformans]MEC1724036.1 flagellin [Schinkia azotoformans]